MDKPARASGWTDGDWAVFYTILVMALGFMIALLAAVSFVGCINSWLYHCVPTTAFVDFAVIWLVPLLITWAPPIFLFVGRSPSMGLKQLVVAYAVVCLLFILFELASALYGIIVVWVPSNTSSAAFSVGIFAATIIMIILLVVQVMQLFFAAALLSMPDVGWRPRRAATTMPETELEVIAQLRRRRSPELRSGLGALPADVSADVREALIDRLVRDAKL